MDNKREIIVMVDDDPTCLTVAKNNLVNKYDIFTVPSADKLFKVLEKVTPHLILLDIEMPQMNGYDAIKILKDNNNTVNIPVIFLTGLIDPESEVKGLSLGAVDYITKPFSKELFLKRIELHLRLEMQRKQLEEYSHKLEEKVKKKTQEIFELQSAILKTVAELVECRDDITGGHIERTQKYLVLLLDIMLKNNVYMEEISAWNIHLFVMSSQLHDVGKIFIRDNILMKPGKLTTEEFEEMKKHSILGANVIEKIEETTSETAFLRHAKLLAASHHEKWDGTGYPNGLKGEEIPLEGRVMAIVDVYDALTSNRQYKKAFSHAESVNIIREGKGTFFDPKLVEVFLKHEAEFENISNRDFIVTESISQQAKEQLIFAKQEIINVIHTVIAKEDGSNKKIRHYLEIFVKALLKSERYKKEILKWDIDFFLISAQLYDIGKANIGSNIINKTGKLTEQEFEDIKNHVAFGMKVIQQVKENVNNEELLHHFEAITFSHHEKWDGTGYPKGLKGEAIPLQGRIMAIVDVYDAITSDRAHRKKMSHAEVIEKMREYSGTHFEPELVAIFLENEKEFENELGSV
ncbi:MAG: HD domain-containing protein [Spirochaetaceae bacterium]|nr:HD domain-containing protein [Spirochaetaceae bacterium]